MTSLPPRSASLAPFFTPNGVAIIGASRDPGKLSYGVVRNLADPELGYPGPIYPVNPKADEILGLKCYPDIAAVPDPVELAVLILPAGMVAGAIEACGQRGILAAVVISGGFREVGPEGAAREAEMVAIAQRHDMRIVGPNGIGVMDMHTPLNTTFVKGMPPKGSIAFLSQSGALCGGIIDWTIGRGIGFSRFLSVGNEADVNETDVIPFLTADDATRVITLYLEDVKGGPAFVDALRDAAARKPVLALKAGRTASGQAATASHTGALAGAHSAFPRPVQTDRRNRSRGHPGAFQRCPGAGVSAVAPGQPHRPGHECGRAGRTGRGRAGRRRAPLGAHRSGDPGRAQLFSSPMSRLPAPSTCWAARTNTAIARRWRPCWPTRNATACWRSWCRRCW